ncbi:hypothetical protein Barb7_02061 [Bacteroidales bacterium Barb7]|nr:hypothetical protein Barb7_02061 [Bacteroidales bacterium Barb7]
MNIPTAAEGEEIAILGIVAEVGRTVATGGYLCQILVVEGIIGIEKVGLYG